MIQKENGGYVRKATRSGPKQTFYYFKVDTDEGDEEDKLISICQNEYWYETEKLDDALALLDNEKDDIFPQGFDYCKNLITDQKNSGGKIHTMVCQTSPKTHFYYKV